VPPSSNFAGQLLFCVIKAFVMLFARQHHKKNTGEYLIEGGRTKIATIKVVE